MELSLELMKQGSYQVEMSDEGMMTGDIENCLRIVINAIQKADLPRDEIVQWRHAMKRNDRVGFICDEELADLEKRLAVRRGK
jgi:hypothetical protein